MAAAIQNGESVVCVKFFACVYLDDDGFSVVSFDASSVRIEHERGIDQIAMILQQPPDAV